MSVFPELGSSCVLFINTHNRQYRLYRLRMAVVYYCTTVLLSVCFDLVTMTLQRGEKGDFVFLFICLERNSSEAAPQPRASCWLRSIASDIQDALCVCIPELWPVCTINACVWLYRQRMSALIACYDGIVMRRGR